jgi:repressor LexA
MKQNTTPRQMQILIFIRDYRHKNGYSPTLQEVGDTLGLTKVTVFEHVGALERKGLLLRGAKHSARSLQVSSKVDFPDERPTRLALVGRIAAGRPIEAVEGADALDLEDLFERKSPTFVLQVTGDSMIDDHICDGDYVVCERRSVARNGETVVALLENGDATLKRFYRDARGIRLQPANPQYEPIHVKEVQVQGVVIGVLRTL